MKILQDICKLTNLTEDDFNKDTMFMNSFPLLELLYSQNRKETVSKTINYTVKTLKPRETKIGNISGKREPIFINKKAELQHREVPLIEYLVRNIPNTINENIKVINKVNNIKEFLTTIEEELFRGTMRDDGMSGLDNLGNYSIIFNEKTFMKNLYFLLCRNNLNMTDAIVILPYLYKDTKPELIDLLASKGINILYSTNPCMLLSRETNISPLFCMYFIASLYDVKLVTDKLTVENNILNWNILLSVLNPQGIRRVDEKEWN